MADLFGKSLGIRILVVLLLGLLVAGGTLGFAPQDDSKQKIVVHLKRYTDDLHAVFMAVKLAGGLQAAGAEVTLFVNLEGARLADARMPKDYRWGEGGKPLSVHYDAFIKAGGRVLVCPHCACAAGIDLEKLRPGVHVATEGEVVKALLAADKILDY